MNAFRSLMVAMIIWIIGITGIVAYKHGLNLVPIFFGDMASLTWPGQFNADFFLFSYTFRFMGCLAESVFLCWAYSAADSCIFGNIVFSSISSYSELSGKWRYENDTYGKRQGKLLNFT